MNMVESMFNIRPNILCLFGLFALISFAGFHMLHIVSQWIKDNEGEWKHVTPGGLMSLRKEKMIKALGRLVHWNHNKMKKITRSMTHFTADQLCLLKRENSMAEWYKANDALDRGVIIRFQPLDMYR